MITMLGAMLMFRIKTLIIGLVVSLAALLGSGCSTIRLGYANGSQLAWWWIDGYFDFSGEQSVQVKRALDRWFAWHRATQLADTAALLASLRQAMPAPTTAAEVCRWQDRAQALSEASVARAIDEFADIVPLLGEAQFSHLQAHYAKLNDEMREEHMKGDADERRRGALKRAVERAEKLYGTLEEAQQRVVAAGVARSPFNPEMSLAERQRRQQDTLQTLRQLVADKAGREQRQAALRGLVQRSQESPVPAHRAYQARLVSFNCALAAELHNAASVAQRTQAGDLLGGWEDDLRSLIRPGA
jgi:hypothetical protein